MTIVVEFEIQVFIRFRDGTNISGTIFDLEDPLQLETEDTTYHIPWSAIQWVKKLSS